MIAGLVLAAGASRRMGQPKMLLPVGRGTLLSAAVAPLLEAGLDAVVVVLGHQADTVRAGARLPEDARLRVVVNADWEQGMASSLRRGLAECLAASAVVVALGDQPGIPAELVRQLMSAHREAGARLALPVHAGRAGHPVLFARALWGELETARGELGGREVVRRHFAEAACFEAVPPCDLDTEQDYQAFLEGRPPRADEGLELPETSH